MVFQNKLDYASSGYHAPAVPHFPRSLRMKRSVRKRVEDPQTYAIDLLANIASKLLAGSENILTPRYKSNTSVPVGSDNDNLLRFEAFDQLSCNEEARSPEDAVNSRMTYGLNHSKTSKSMSPGSASLFQKFGVSDETAIGEEFKFVRDNYKVGISVIDVHEKCGNEELHSTTLELLKSKELMSKKTVQGEKEMARDVTNGKTSDVFRAADPMNLDTNFPDLVSSDNSVKVSLYRKNVPQTGPFDNTKDDKGTNEDKNADENSSGCTQSIFTSKESRLHRTGDHGRIKKILASKFSKVAPTMLREDEIVNYEKKTSSCSKRMSCTRQRTPISSFKRRKWFERYSSTTSDRGAYCEGVSNSCKKNSIKSEPNDSHDTSCGANGAWSSRIETKSGFNSPDYHVKLSIKSFEVPELVLDLPETATVGSLKRTILDAVTAILGGGLHVGVVLEGKKVADDNKTLHQAGISHGDELDNLGFILEPSPRQTTGKLTSVESPHLQGLRCSADPLAKVPLVAAFVKDQQDFAATQQPVKMCPKSDHDSIHSQPIAASHEKLTANSLALVVVPPVSMEALAMVPLHSKPKIKRAEAGQRRARRPFSVAEVEALVQAVEKLGTGRWRDVKLCAFENAKHRTYVDLKDKWKTLVHTAEISPQQRRGEPVPQELLDRVLSAHAYWSQQQSKLQAKPLPPAETRLLLS